MLNVNVPPREVRGVRVTRQSRKTTQNVIYEKKDPRGRPYYWQDETDNVEPDSDYAAIRAHEISITPLQVDRTDYASLNHLSSGCPKSSPLGCQKNLSSACQLLHTCNSQKTVLVRQPETLVLSSD